MAAQRKKGSCYVYRIYDGHETVYVGKGSGRRLSNQKRRFACDGEIIRGGLTDDEAFRFEREMIAALKPTGNVAPGGNGGRLRSKPLSSFARALMREAAEVDRVGSRVFAARFLLRKLDERNCERWGVSRETLTMLRSVAAVPASPATA